MENKAIKLIEDAYKNKSEFLDLGNCSLTSIPKEIIRLSPFLKHLNLGSNYRNEFNELVKTSNRFGDNKFFDETESFKFLEQLTNLEKLDIYNGGINNLGEYISKLQNLKSLNIAFNHLGDIEIKLISDLHTLHSLDIASNRITNMGVLTLSNLPYLSYLNVSSNNIGASGAKLISEISNLTSLDISSNNIGRNGAGFLSSLSNLKFLDISNNNIGQDGAKSISKISGLSSLDISSNEIDDFGAENISKLSLLSYLNVSNNKITLEGAEFFGLLKQIKTLFLLNNKIEELSFNLINEIGLEVDFEIDQIYLGFKFFMFGNPIDNPPPEVLKQGRDAILEYLQGDLRPLNECKLIFIGDGSVGKTSLMKRLVNNTFNKDEKTTHGINKIAWFGLKNETNEDLKVNLWDFGGQHIQHSLHQFFFTERVIYVLILNPRNDEKANYWLEQVEKLGRDSKILIVYNWKDLKDKQSNYLSNFYELRKTYPKLPEPIILSCATGEGIEDFREAVKKVILDSDGLKTRYPIKWFEIKEKLEKDIPIETNYIEYAQYEKWCFEKGYNDPIRRKNLLNILNSIGSIIFFDKPILNRLQVLNPEWITTGAYAILTSEITKCNKGHLKWNDLQDIFKEDKEIFSDKNIKIKYTDQQFQFIIQLMLNYRLCQKNPLEEHEFLIPTAFGEKPQKDYEIKKNDSRHYRFQFESSFEMLIIHQFIAKNIIHIVSNDYWNSGIYFKHTSSKTFALVETNLYSKQINCWITGENIRGMWEVIRNDFREIFKMYHNFPVKEEVEFTVNDRIIFFPYQEMLNSLKKGKTIIDYHPTYDLESIDVQYVLGLFEPPEQTTRAVRSGDSPNFELQKNSPTPSLEKEDLSDIEILQLKEIQSQSQTNTFNENRSVRKWKRHSTILLLIALVASISLLLIYLNEWIFQESIWVMIKKKDGFKWIGIISAFVWNGFIGKMFYDRHLDPSKEKAYRDNLKLKLATNQ